MIYHVYTAYEPADLETQRRHRVAQETWQRQPWREMPVSDQDMARMWHERGRSFPYVKDVLNAAADKLRAEDILIYTNADNMVRADCCTVVAEALQHSDACYCFRRDFHHRVLTPIPDSDYGKGLDYAGSDLVAFRVEWWQHFRDEFPDMIMAAEAWDAVMRTLIDLTCPQPERRVHDVICHERHGSYWENPAHRYTLKSQRHNLGLAKAFLIENGIEPRRFGIAL